MRTRQDIYDWEQVHLASYASRASETRGREHPEPEHAMRSPFERDRDRIIHSSAFRRLEYKTQVFVTHAGDWYRTRLTHTLEVAQISRSVARLLGLNEDLAEAIALVHDLGHPPFGHAGEKALLEEMADHGGFEHNQQGLRVITLLERRYPGFPGLNLTWEVREGIAKHSRLFDATNPLSEHSPFAGSRWPSLEAQVADACDQIAYNAHDVDDGVTAGMIALGDLETLKLWRFVHEDAPAFTALSDEQRKYLGVRALINAQVSDLARTSEHRLAEWGVAAANDAREAPWAVAGLSAEMQTMNDELREFLFAHVYRDYRQTRMWHKARRVIASMFTALASAPEQLPPSVSACVADHGLPRAVCDHLASLTDREALQEHGRLFDL